MVPIYEPVAGRPAGEANMEDVGTGKELGVLVLMSSRPSPFKQDELIITALAEIVGLHIWGNRRLAELDYDRQQVAQLRQAAQNSQQAIFAASTSASASAGTVHSAKKHIADIAEPFEKLINHQRLKQDTELYGLARQIYKPFQELSVLYDRLHLLYAGAEPNFRECDLSLLMQEVRSYMETTLRERNIVLHNNIEDVPKVKADDILMKVVFINLIRNSIEANARKITVSAKTTTMGVPGVEPRPAIEVHFKDDGFGIPHENWKDVFNLFFTAHKKGGSGVGLAVNRSIMNKHKGRIRVVSSAVGEGTTIALVWPIDLPGNG
jgi:signal transduction histidine kinase